MTNQALARKAFLQPGPLAILEVSAPYGEWHVPSIPSENVNPSAVLASTVLFGALINVSVGVVCIGGFDGLLMQRLPSLDVQVFARGFPTIDSTLQIVSFSPRLTPIINAAKVALQSAFGSESFERGAYHNSEVALRSLLTAAGADFSECLRQLLLAEELQDYLPDLLESLGRLPITQIGDAAIGVIGQHLVSADYGVRDGAIGALEHWLPNDTALRILRTHMAVEPDSYLKKYIGRLVLTNEAGRQYSLTT